MFIELDENNNIVASSDLKFSENTIETDKEIVRNCKGELVFKENLNLEQELSSLKQQKLIQLKSNCSNYIYSVYPIYKQLNIANDICEEDDKKTMNTFINEKRTICNTKETALNNCTTKEEIEGININFVR